MRCRLNWALFLGIPCLLVGCSNAPSRVLPDSPDPRAGEVAMKTYDTNHDGQLNAAELEQTPGLKAALKEVDANHDGQLNAGEIRRSNNA